MVDTSDLLDIAKELKFPNLARTKYNVTSLENPRFYGSVKQILRQKSRFKIPKE